MKSIFAAIFVLIFASQIRAQLNSGPDPGSNISPLRVAVITGENAGETLEVAQRRGALPTIYIFIQADKWDRPLARFLRALDDDLRKDRSDVAVVVTWLTDDVEAAKDYLPKAQQSIQLSQTSLAVSPGDKNGPTGWSIDARAHLTAVVASDSRVVAKFAYRSLNETNVPEVIAKLPPVK